MSILWLYLLFVGPYILFAWLIPELATVLAALCMLGFSVIYLRRDGLPMNMKAWLPYTLLALLLLLPKVFGTLRRVLDVEIGFSNMLGTDIGGGFQPLLSPFVPFVLIGLAVAYIKKCNTWQLGSSLKKVGQVSVILYPSIVIAQLMILSDVVQPSMVEHIAILKGKLGDVYPFFSPFVGVVGTFITGSTTLSNIVFGPSQLTTADMLLMDRVAILSLQHAGASIGNAICLFNIIAAAAIAGINNFSGILSGNLKPTLWLAGLLGLLGMVLVHVL